MSSIITIIIFDKGEVSKCTLKVLIKNKHLVKSSAAHVPTIVHLLILATVDTSKDYRGHDNG